MLSALKLTSLSICFYKTLTTNINTKMHDHVYEIAFYEGLYTLYIVLLGIVRLLLTKQGSF